MTTDTFKKQLSVKFFFVAIFAATTCLLFAFKLYGQETEDPTTASSPAATENKNVESVVDSRNQEEINIIRGDLESVKVYNLLRLSISNPEIADVANADGNQILLMGKTAGQTALFIWDEYGKRTIIIRVFDEDLDGVQERIEDLLQRSEIKGVHVSISEYEGRVVLTGNLPSDKLDEVSVLVEPFGGTVMNLIREDVIEDLVQIDVQIAEINRTYSRNLGVDWSNAVQISEGTAEDEIFKVGTLTRTTSISAIINAAVTAGKARILSKPKLVVVSGKEASFLVGGEIPITTTNTSSGGNVQQNVEFKDFGISLTITPIVRDNGKVDVVMSVEVSDIDSAHAVGTTVAFTTRTAQTQLLLDDGQTAVLAGLIKHTEGETVSKVPFLGDIPIIGLIFRNQNMPNKDDTELVISLTPSIIRQTISKESHSVASTAKKSEDTGAPLSVGMPSDSASSMPEPERVQEDILEPYVKSIQEKISQAISYPLEAKEKGWEGTVKLSMTLLKDGSLADISVKESSGYSIFDKDALNTAQILAPYAPFPEELKLEEVVLTVPIVYSQTNFSKDPSYGAKIQSTSESKTSKAYIPSGMTYEESVQRQIAEAIVYPEEARDYGWEGTVKLGLHILKDGTLAYASVKESSGYQLFDDSALKTAKNLAPYSGFPSGADLEELNVTVPIVYSLNK